MGIMAVGNCSTTPKNYFKPNNQHNTYHEKTNSFTTCNAITY